MAHTILPPNYDPLESGLDDRRHFENFLPSWVPTELKSPTSGYKDSTLNSAFRAYTTLKGLAQNKLRIESKRTGPYVIALTYDNETGHRAFQFAETPYVHSGLQAATQEARRLARRNEKPYSVFGYCLTANVEQPAKTEIDLDDFAGRLALELQQRDRTKDMPTMRALVDDAISKTLINAD